MTLSHTALILWTWHRNSLVGSFYLNGCADQYSLFHFFTCLCLCVSSSLTTWTASIVGQLQHVLSAIQRLKQIRAASWPVTPGFDYGVKSPISCNKLFLPCYILLRFFEHKGHRRHLSGHSNICHRENRKEIIILALVMKVVRVLKREMIRYTVPEFQWYAWSVSRAKPYFQIHSNMFKIQVPTCCSAEHKWTLKYPFLRAGYIIPTEIITVLNVGRV